ncbi:CD226 antigen isoform X2 [Erpetoichthys calabaricus]|uniref:CD226 antigen isoform X2 n=1 Tax=Erpetoichthys calabaricus TaxID=27687 RepID=UPI0022340803|nr:CD226 antigen isoform X2 [Erpetoichthys calabaricus]
MMRGLSREGENKTICEVCTLTSSVMFQGNRKLWLTLGGRLHKHSERRMMEGRRVDYLIFSITLLSLHGDALKTHNPDLNIEIKEANDFLLKCNYNLKGTIYSVVIQKLGDGFKDNVASCSFAHRPLVGADYIERSILNCTDFLQVSLLLKNVTVDDEGLYRCHFTMKEENRTTTVSLTVIKEKDDLIKTLSIYIGAGLGFLIAVLITTVICLKRKKKKRMRKRAKHPPARRRHYNNYQQSMIHDRVSKRPNDRTHEDIYINLKNVSNPTRKKKTTFG